MIIRKPLLWNSCNFVILNSKYKYRFIKFDKYLTNLGSTIKIHAVQKFA